jgi:hypothetical protein
VRFPEGSAGALGAGSPVAGPTFRHVYKLFGGTIPGEFVGEDGEEGKYCLSYPGIAFLFPMHAPAGFSKLDWASTVSVLSSSTCAPASSMVLYDGGSWHAARKTILTADMSFPRVPVLSGRKEGIPAEVEMAKVHDRGRIELVRKDAPPFWLVLSETTPQDLVTELGPPDSTYKKNNRSTAAHHGRRASSSSSRRSSDVLDGDQRSSSSHTDNSDNSVWEDDDDDEETTTVANDLDKDDAGIWWNYYSYGLDILITQPTRISNRSPTLPRHAEDSEESSSEVDEEIEPTAHNFLTATKVILHSNIPGSYQFNRHRRLRWTLEDWPGGYTEPLTSEMKFRDIQCRLKEVFKDSYESVDKEREQQQPIAINRDWGESSSLGGSVELLGGWEESGRKKGDESTASGEEKIGEVLMFGFPGIAFEVLKNGVVGLLQVW